jgi:hypothetical protein
MRWTSYLRRWLRLLLGHNISRPRVADYEYSKVILDQFGESAAAEAARQELEVAGPLALGNIQAIK